MNKKVYKLIISYLIILLLYIAAYQGSKWLTGRIHENSSLYIGGVLIVDKGKAYGSAYLDHLIWFTIMMLLLSSVWVLKKDNKEYKNKIHYFLASNKINTLFGILFVFNGLGLVFQKSIPDPVIRFLGQTNLSIIALVAVRLILREIYFIYLRLKK